MPPKPRRKPEKAIAPDDSEEDFETQNQLGVTPGLASIVANINIKRATRTKIRKEVDDDQAKHIKELKAKITKHYQTEAQKQSNLISKQLERLTKAVEKKATCEDSMLKLMASLAKDGAHMAALMNAVHSGRKEAIHTAVSSNPPEKK